MTRRETTKEKEDYMTDIYKAKVEIAIARWESGGYPRKERQPKPIKEH